MMPRRGFFAIVILLLTGRVARAATQSPSEFYRLTMREGRLSAQWLAPGWLDPPVSFDTTNPPRSWRFETPGVPQNQPEMSGRFFVACLDRSPSPEGTWHVYLHGQQRDPHGVQIIATLDHAGGTMNINLLQSRDGIRCELRDVRPERQTMEYAMAAPDLSRLRLRYPQDVRKYVVPVLEHLGAADALVPPAADVYRAFPQIAADPKVTTQVQELLAALDSVDPAERRRASAALEDLGRPGVLAILRMTQQDLSPQQRFALQSILAAHSNRPASPTVVDDARADVPFLVDCLDDPDLTVRTAALNAMETTLGHEVRFDPNLPREQRDVQSDRLRESLRNWAPKGR
jgi:hypothetical protein